MQPKDPKTGRFIKADDPADDDDTFWADALLAVLIVAGLVFMIWGLNTLVGMLPS